MEKPKLVAKQKATRQHVRLDTSFPLEFTVVDKEKYLLLKKNIPWERTLNRGGMGDRPMMGASGDVVDDNILKKLDPDLAEIWSHQIRRMVSLEKKLDQVLHLLKRPADEEGRGRDSHEAICKNICGSGLAFLGNTFIEPKALLEIRMQLPKLPPTPVDFLGVAVKSEIANARDRDKGRFLTAVQISVINEEDREEIIAFVLERLRDRLKAVNRKKG